MKPRNDHALRTVLESLLTMPLQVRPSIYLQNEAKTVRGDESFQEWFARLTNFSQEENEFIAIDPRLKIELEKLKIVWAKLSDFSYETIEGIEQKLAPILESKDDLIDVVPWACQDCGKLVEMSKLKVANHLRTEHQVDVKLAHIKSWIERCRARVPIKEETAKRAGNCFNYFGERVFPPRPLNIGAVGLPRRR